MFRKEDYLLLQINDALFPIGGYSHSYGLETYITNGMVSDGNSTADYLSHYLKGSFLYSDLLVVKLAYAYTVAGQYDKILQLEAVVLAAKIAKEGRQAMQKLGSRFLKTLLPLDIAYQSDAFLWYHQNSVTPLQPVAFGVFCAAVDIQKKTMFHHYLYAKASSLVTTCVKTIPLSQTIGQQLLWQCSGYYSAILATLDTLTEEDLCLSEPGFDLRSMQHEALYSRIYMS